MGSFSIWHWLVVAVIVLLVFGTSRLRSAGKDLGEAVKGFKKGVRDDDAPPARLADDVRRDEDAARAARESTVAPGDRRD